MKLLAGPAVVIGVSALLGALSSAYMALMVAPSVIAVRPNLADVGFWTAMWSGRFDAWLWHHHPVFMTSFIMVVWVLTGAGVLAGSSR